MIGGRIKQVRLLNKLTQKEFAEEIGIKQSALSYIESGKNAPKLKTVRMIADRFRISESWLVSGEYASPSVDSFDYLVRENRALRREVEKLRAELDLYKSKHSGE